MKFKIFVTVWLLAIISIFMFDDLPFASNRYRELGRWDTVKKFLHDTVFTGTTTIPTATITTSNTTTDNITTANITTLNVLGDATVDSVFIGGHGDPRGMADSTFTGEPVIWKADENIEFGETCYLDGDQEYALGDADALTTAKVKVMCVQRSGIQANAYGKFLHRGYVYFTPWTTISCADDSVDVYVSVTAGQPTIVRPSGTGDTVVNIGYVVAEDKMFLWPSNTYVGVP